MIRVGTHHFVSVSAACRYYRSQGNDELSKPELVELVDRKIVCGEIAIGKPSVPPGGRLKIIDNSTRYAIEEPEAADRDKDTVVATPENLRKIAERDASERAFPVSTNAMGYGMSLRDWFAGQALANEALGRAYHNRPDILAAKAFEYADAMLAARAKGGAS